jgi:hypothetical protein
MREGNSRFLRVSINHPQQKVCGGPSHMRNHWLIFLLFFVVVPGWGQEKPVTTPDKKTASSADDDDDRPVPPPPSAANIAPDAAVLTIKGLCPQTSNANEISGANCQTVITRTQFEKLARAIQPSLSPVVKKQLMNLYPRLLIMSREAEARGLDKDEYFQQMFELARMQILTQQLTRSIQEEAAKVPEQEIADYYHQNPDQFQEYTLERIYIPRVKQEPPPAQKLSDEAEKERQKRAEDEMTKLAEALRARAAKGESFEALQKEAYQSAGMKSTPPNASMGKLRRNGLPPGHDAVFSLKAGEVSQVISDAGGHYIYKVDSTDAETLADAKGEIHNLLQSQRLHSTMEKIQGPFTTEVNDAYFGTGAATASSQNWQKQDSGGVAAAPK